MRTSNPLGGSFANNYYYPGSTSIIINTGATFDYSLPGNDITNADFYEAILHELGHALGLDHINDNTSLMFWETQNNTTASNRIDLRAPSNPENPAIKTNSVEDANFIVTQSEDDNSLTSSVQSNCSPSSPVNLSAIAANAGEVNLSWTAASNMDYYTLTRSDGGVPYPNPSYPAGISSASDFNVTPGSTYTYTLTAWNSFGSASTTSNTVMTPLLVAPGNIQISISSNGQPTISWSGNGSSYNIYVSSDGGKTYTLLKSNVTSTSYTDITAKSGMVYIYKIQANGGNKTAQTTIIVSTINTSCSTSTSTINYTSILQLLMTESSYAKNTITAGTNVSIVSGRVNVFWAGTLVKLTPGFSALNGSTFQAKIVACSSTKSAEEKDTISNITTVTPVETVKNEVGISIYPNPNNGSFTVSLTNESVVEIVVINMFGQMVQYTTNNNTGSSFAITLPNVSKGMYIVRLKGKQKTYMQKIVVE